MTDVHDVISPEAAKAAADATAKAEADKAAADAEAAKAAGEKVGDILGERKQPKMYDESVILDFKNENKGLWTELKKTQDMIAEGLSKREVTDTLTKIGEKYKVSPDFLKEVASAIRAETDADIDKKITERTPAKREEKKDDATDKDGRIDRIFKEHFTKTLTAMPEYKDVADADTVKALTLLPENAQKTFAQILEKAYGHLVKGQKKEMDAAPPGGRQEPATIDFNKAAKDPEYYRSVMADPAMKKEYNKDLAKRLKL